MNFIRTIFPTTEKLNYHKDISHYPDNVEIAIRYFINKYPNHISYSDIVNEFLLLKEEQLSFEIADLLYFYLHQEHEKSYETNIQLNRAILEIVKEITFDKINNFTVEISFENSTVFIHVMDRLFSILREMTFDERDMIVFKNVIQLPMKRNVFYRFISDYYFILTHLFKDSSGLEFFLQNNKSDDEYLQEEIDELMDELKEKGRI